jgi:hypothetical protein
MAQAEAGKPDWTRTALKRSASRHGCGIAAMLLHRCVLRYRRGWAGFIACDMFPGRSVGNPARGHENEPDHGVCQSENKADAPPMVLASPPFRFT